MKLLLPISCLVLMLGPMVLPAQDGGQQEPPAIEQKVPLDVIRNAIGILNQQIMTLTETVEQIEGNVQSLNNGNATALALGEADRLVTELQQTKEFYRFVEIIVVALLGILALYVILWHLRKADEAKRGNNPNHVGLAPQDIMNVSGLSLIVFGTILVVIIADVDQQLTASVGILGALAGYLFRGLHESGNREPAPPAGIAQADDDRGSN